MEITGKCKRDFEVWLFDWLSINIANEGEIPQQEDIDFFYKYPNAMKWGVFIEFFDYKMIDIDDFFEEEIGIILIKNEGIGDMAVFNKEARVETVKTINEYYNNKIKWKNS